MQQASKREEFCFVRSWLLLLSAWMKTRSGSRVRFGVAVLPAVTFLGRRLCRGSAAARAQRRAVVAGPWWPGRHGTTDRERNERLVFCPRSATGNQRPLLCCSRCPHYPNSRDQIIRSLCTWSDNSMQELYSPKRFTLLWDVTGTVTQLPVSSFQQPLSYLLSLLFSLKWS